MAAQHDTYFGPGNGTLVPSGAAPTPYQIALLSDCTVKISRELKPLEGDKMVAIDMGEAGRKCTISAKMAEWRADVVSAILGGTLTSAGRLSIIDGEAATIPGTPYQVTVTNTTGWIDLGVRDVTNSGKPMTRVAAGPTAGQYSCAAGVYTFAAADTTHNLLIRYAWTPATGKKVVVANQATGISTPFTLYLGNANGADKDYAFIFKAVHVASFGFGFKKKDWNEHDVEIEAIADANGNWFERYQNA